MDRWGCSKGTGGRQVGCRHQQGWAGQGREAEQGSNHGRAPRKTSHCLASQPLSPSHHKMVLAAGSVPVGPVVLHVIQHQVEVLLRGAHVACTAQHSAAQHGTAQSQCSTQPMCQAEVLPRGAHNAGTGQHTHSTCTAQHTFHASVRHTDAGRTAAQLTVAHGGWAPWLGWQPRSLE